MVKFADMIEYVEAKAPEGLVCIIDPRITLSTLIVVLTAVSHGLLVIDAAKLHFYGIKCTLKMAKNAPQCPTLLPVSTHHNVPCYRGLVIRVYSARERWSSGLLMTRVTSQLKMFPRSPPLRRPLHL